MDPNQILRLMQNAGFRACEVSPDGEFITFEDPTCILRAFSTFAEYAWIAMACATALLLFGWAISMIRGAKNDIFTNIRNLTLIFGITAAVIPIINVIYGDDLFARGCKTVRVATSDIQTMLDARNAKLSPRNKDLFENLDIYDTGAQANRNTDNRTQNTESVPVTGTNQPAQNNVLQQPIINDDAGNLPTSARGDKDDVIYVYSDGRMIRRKKGTRAWRNNNPGNIRPGKFTRSVGSIGAAGKFAVFPDDPTGMNAIIALLKTSNYQNKTVGDAIMTWAPPSENNTASYQNTVKKSLGVSLDTPMKTLTPEQLQKMAQTIRQVEGWRPGSEILEKGM